MTTPNYFSKSFALLLVSTFVLTACGQKGALYLPNNAITVKKLQPSTVVHNQDEFILPKSSEAIQQDSQQRIKQLQAKPNDY